MKKLICWILILTMILSLAACGKKDAAETTAEPEAETAVLPAEEELTEEAPNIPEAETVKPMFADQLDGYYTALQEGWTPDQYTEAGLNYMPGMVKDINSVGYYMDDINMDGIPELLIGAVGEPEIYAMYTLVNEEETEVISAGERNVFWLESDGVFVNRGSNSASNSGYFQFVLEEGKLVFQDALIFDSEADAENPWFYAVDQDWDVTNDNPIDTAEAESIVAQMEESKVQIPFAAFAEYAK